MQCYRDVEIGHQKDEGEYASCKAGSAVDCRGHVTQVAQTNSNMALTSGKRQVRLSASFASPWRCEDAKDVKT